MITDKLMFGNWIGVRTAQSNDYFTQIIETRSDGYSYRKDKTKGVAIRSYPIPLTPEILDKAGFIRYDDGGALYEIYKTDKGIFISMAKADIPYGFLDLKGRWYIGDCHTEIKFLHHLQNYIYIVYGTELTITL